jgi:hypothetical protein
MPSRDLKMVDSFSMPNSIKKRFDPFLFSRPSQKRNGFADGLACFIAEDAGCTGIPTGNNARQRLSDDRVVGRINDGSKPLLRIERI